MSFKPRYFGYSDQYGTWSELAGEPTPAELGRYREVEVFYEALAVERANTHYRSFFEEIGKRVSVLPEWLQKFYFDMKRRIENEHQTGNRKEVPKSPIPISHGKN